MQPSVRMAKGVFGRNTNFDFAARLWPHLVAAAAKRGRITYGEASEACGRGSPSGMNQVCWLLHLYCRRNGWPPLNALVVNKETRLPSDGIPGQYYGPPEPDAETIMDWAWRFDWSKAKAPTNEDLRKDKNWYYAHEPVSGRTAPVIDREWINRIERG